MRQALHIGTPLRLIVRWVDRVCEPEQTREYDGEVISWRDTQLIVRVKDYAVIRFWKKSGLEVGNKDHERRGLSIDLKELEDSLKPAPGVAVDLDAINREEATREVARGEA